MSDNRSPAMLERGVVTLREELMPGVWLLRLHSPEIARTGQAGQFVHVQVAEGTDPFLRRPFSFSDIDVKAGTYDILFNVTGRGTSMLAAAEAGQAFDVLGPLGRPFSFPESGVLLAVAGGLGVAPFPMVAREARRRDLGFRWLNGAYTAHQLLPTTLLPRHAEVLLVTDDGSNGTAGLVTDLLAEAMQNVAMVHACGPTPMLVAIARRLAELEASGRWMPRCEVSMEAPMGCALGTCLGCVVPAADGNFTRVCVEGAVFERRELDWNALAALGPLIHHSRAAERLPSGTTVG